MPEPDCRHCGCPASWHLKHAAQMDKNRIHRGRCIAKKRKANGFPSACGCTAYRALKLVTA